ncbi:MAG TPA: addiction module protein [Candidatus Methylacidiphilales bacterium]|nr:addiction module protein [Candidatus Methylacidiphilales bacterium]
MTIRLPLDKMTVREKLRMMEELWEDLSRDPDNIKSPDWHRQALKEREARIASGQAKFIPWEKAKEEIRRRIRSAKKSVPGTAIME